MTDVTMNAPLHGLPDGQWRAGIDAHAAGQPITDNPNPAGVPVHPDKYPGPRRSWSDGWHHAANMQAHTEALKNG